MSERLELICKLGLTRNQGKVYLSLVSQQELTIKEIANRANLRTEVIYRIMPKLLEKGLVNKAITAPIRFAAIPLSDAIKILLEQKRIESLEVSNLAKQLLSSEPESYQDIKPKNEMMLIPQGKYILSFTKSKMEELEESYDLILPEKILYNRYSIQGNDFRKIWSNKKINCRFIVECNECKSSLIKILDKERKNGNLDFRISLKQNPVYVGIFDNKGVIIRSKLKGLFMETDLYWSNNPCFVVLSKIYFEKIWEESQKYPFSIEPIIQ